MQIIIKKVGEPHEVRTMEKLELEDMQSMVGGYIECLHVGNGVDMWLNDEGKLYNLPVNLVLGTSDKQVLDTIHGDIFFASADDEGATVGLTVEQIDWIEDKLDTEYFAARTSDGRFDFVPVWIYEN